MKLKRFIITKKNNKLTQYDVDSITYSSMTIGRSQKAFRLTNKNHLIVKTSYCIDEINDEWESFETDLGQIVLTSDSLITIDCINNM